MSKDPKIVRILLVGDGEHWEYLANDIILIHTAGCGKTSIILALVGEEFPLYVCYKLRMI